jgi:hypothetical protein
MNYSSAAQKVVNSPHDNKIYDLFNNVERLKITILINSKQYIYIYETKSNVGR